MNLKVWCVFISLFLIPISLFGNQNIEVGLVNWSRDLDEAYSKSHSTGKPVLVLFQEVPGCSGCKTFGRDVLSHPLLVEAIENEFHPVLVYNNRSGADEKLLKKFKEPAWNYQVLRFLDAKGEDIIPRKDKVWSLEAVVKRMMEALTKVDRQVPNYLKTLLAEVNFDKYEKVAFSMYCFWTGEMKLGGLEGVIGTEAGWLEGHEVTLVTYDKSILQLNNLIDRAKELKCANEVFTSNRDLIKNYRKAKASDQKKQLSRLKTIPNLTKMQASKMNAYVTVSMPKALEWLSPKQKSYLLSH